MKDEAPVRIGVVGTGLIGTVHAERIASNPDTELAVVCGLDEDAPALANRLRTAFVTDFRDVLSHQIGAVVIATPNHLHAPMGRFFLEAGIPVMMEKPIADTVARGLELCGTEDTTGVPILVAHHRRHNSLVEEARRVISSEIGDLLGFTTMIATKKPDSYYGPAWRRGSEAGPLLVNLIHELDLVRFVCGEIVAVQASTRRLARPWDFEDTAAVVLHLESGAMGAVFVSESTPSPWSCEGSVSEGMGFHNAGQDYARFMGKQGALSFPSLTLWSYDEGDGEPGWLSQLRTRTLSVPWSDPYVRQIDHFARVVRGETAPLVSGKDGLRSLASVEAVTEAGRTGRVVDVDALIARNL